MVTYFKNEDKFNNGFSKIKYLPSIMESTQRELLGFHGQTNTALTQIILHNSGYYTCSAYYTH